MDGAKAQGAVGIAFVTNQEITLADREKWEQLDSDLRVDLFHLLRVTQILDDPKSGRTREEFLDIVGGPPPMLVSATVIGTAHAFADDAEVLDRFVGICAGEIRQESDEGHARVRAEQKAKARAEQQQLAQQRRESASRDNPWNIGVGMPNFTDLIDTSRFVGSFPGLPAVELPVALQQHLLPGGAQPNPPEPLTQEQIQEKVAEYRTTLESRWPSCRDYLAGIAWPALQYRIKNQAKSFLTDVEVILTFHGARGVGYEELELFEFEKVEDPSWVRPVDPLRHPVPLPRRLAPPADYPLKWRHDDDGNLEVTIRLPRLRPHPEWRSDGCEDVVLVVDPDVDLDEVTVTYTVTAHGYGDVFEGEPITVGIDEVEMLDVLREVIEATRAAS